MGRQQHHACQVGTGCKGGNRTRDLRGITPSSYHCSTLRLNGARSRLGRMDSATHHTTERNGHGNRRTDKAPRRRSAHAFVGTHRDAKNQRRARRPAHRYGAAMPIHAAAHFCPRANDPQRARACLRQHRQQARQSGRRVSGRSASSTRRILCCDSSVERYTREAGASGFGSSRSALSSFFRRAEIDSRRAISASLPRLNNRFHQPRKLKTPPHHSACGLPGGDRRHAVRTTPVEQPSSATVLRSESCFHASTATQPLGDTRKTALPLTALLIFE